MGGLDIDLKADGGYVIAPPSIHASGHVYSWASNSDKSAPLAKLPLGFLPIENSKPKEKVRLEEFIGTPEGSRDDRLFKAISSLESRKESLDSAIGIALGLNNTFQPPFPTDYVREKVKHVYSSYSKGDQLGNVEDVYGESYIREMELAKDAPTTGFADLDEAIGGFKPGHLITMSAHTNHGKTTLSANFAVTVAKQGHRVAYFPLETRQSIVGILSSIVHSKRIGDYEKGDLEGLPIYVPTDDI